MTAAWPRTEVVETVKRLLLRPGVVTEGFTGVGVVAEAGRLLVVFRWRRDPNTYAIELDFPTAPESPWTGLTVDSAEEWAADVASLLMEELLTGLVVRGRRTVREGHVLLDRRAPEAVWPAGYHVGEVHLGDDPLDAGFWLADAGMDVSVPRRLIAGARLVCWLQAYVDNDRGEPYVGHAAASWEDDGRTTARLDVAYVRPGVPPELRTALARLAVHEAAAAGAVSVVTTLDDPGLRGLGFRPADGGGLVLGTRSVA
ncbi:hypothetical protein Nocox_39970 [Nonomuraea coxensis DSM 45129]|uniref:N-acetyltransferase domain-containing protein n=1 Tax=Nonomuraea coxensis DSM 45129 TaxID=1122611 RepID=A0ABX8UGR1_9ACTN|nr:hypothetical protein Nocox_39970 [Nonomuraea coxensis DSM 45129]